MSISQSEPTFKDEMLMAKLSEQMIEHNNIARAARNLDIPYHKAQQLVQELKMRWMTRSSVARDKAMAEQIAKLDRIEEALWPLIRQSGLTAIDRIIPILEMRNKMLGLYAATKVDITARVREMAIANGIDPDEAVREAQRLIDGGLTAVEQ